MTLKGASRGGARTNRRRGKRQTEARSGRGGSARRTTDHDQIRRWAEARGGTPAIVRRTAKGQKQSGVLRIDFPGFSGKGSLKPVSWDEWFETFEDRRLALLYQNKTATGKPSRFNKLVCR